MFGQSEYIVRWRWWLLCFFVNKIKIWSWSAAIFEFDKSIKKKLHNCRKHFQENSLLIKYHQERNSGEIDGKSGINNVFVIFVRNSNLRRTPIIILSMCKTKENFIINPPRILDRNILKNLIFCQDYMAVSGSEYKFENP